MKHAWFDYVALGTCIGFFAIGKGIAMMFPDPPTAGFGIGLMLGVFVGALAACLCGLVPFP